MLRSASLMPDSGVMYPPIDKVTSQGFDLQFGTNVLGAKSRFHFTHTHTHIGTMS